MLGKINDYGVDDELRGITAEQASSAELHGLDFLKKVVRFPGVRINRDEFLRQELTKLRASEEVIERALATSPALAGVPLLALDTLAYETITYETNKSAALSFAAGLPGGFAMLGTIPADLMQYYAHALRIMQKLAYLYGWRDLLADVDEDDEMLGVLAVFFGVMLGVGGAAQSLTAFARIAAKTAYQKHVTKRALMSITWYPVVKYSLRVIGINITKSSFTKGASKIVPVIGGFVSSGLTFMALQTQSARLKGHLRELPPPGIDAEGWAQHVLDTTPARGKQLVADEVQKTMKGKARVVMVGAKGAVSGIAEGATGIAGGVKQRLRKGK
ncbi:EcsC family protein [uncultured Actinomyces sp.]|uniref:EcsC family protein n=1 Tax=uncultured Actinomyces sp. TaxID=249061 RepID=UPI0028E97FA1|nr:EcsC family protein [uncultured Actinomyces sp.]